MKTGAVAALLCILFMASSVVGATPGGVAAFEHGDYVGALASWQERANHDPRAQYGLGLLYANGWGVPANSVKALHWYTLAAERGQPLAQYNLAVMRQRGDAVPRDYAEAAFWYAEAARQGLSAAVYNLALMTLAGQGPRAAPARALAMLDTVAADDRARVIAALPFARVTVATANLRQAPNLDASVRAHAGRGSPVRVVGRDGDWARVWLPRQHVVGWMAGRLLEPSDTRIPADYTALAHGPSTRLTMESVDTIAPAAPTLRLALVGRRALAPMSSAMQVAAPRLNVRTQPATTAPVRGQLHRGTVVQVMASQGGWRRVQTESGLRGWVAAFLLRAL